MFRIAVFTVLGSLLAVGGLTLFRWLDRRPGPEETVRAFFGALREGDCQAAANDLSDQSLAWLADPGGYAEGRDQFVQLCEETIAVEQEGLELVSTEGVSERSSIATVRVAVRRASGTEASSEIDLVDEPGTGWGLDLSSLAEVLEMPDLATIPDPADASEPQPPVRPLPRPPRPRP